ncbi:MAG: hypothetical protein OJF59_001681 [Cytophagales bacterium]|jgi:copper chaperone CopZ|nr:hypothetical protein [Bacteroidota bacterium]MBS1980606.1 hypothetical protein [Bacteroidota bacterium]WHZ07928.1 MAG: hypothetical protein OJF59_001681 [Cytophagales bacterium]
METTKFKTNINCSGCIARATDALNNAAGKDNWTVDTNNPNKILTINNAGTKAEVVRAVQNLGFKIEEITAS